ncbi:MAG: hypothetical protein WBA46_02540 [Thermomicrobiales bacterium]
MPPPRDQADASFRRARFTVPPPPGNVAGAVDRLRLVDPTGSAVAWIGYGERLVVLGFLVCDPNGAWQGVLRDWIVDVGAVPQAWTLIERDPTMARLRCAISGQPALMVQAEVDGGILSILQDQRVLLRVGIQGDSSSPDARAGRS